MIHMEKSWSKQLELGLKSFMQISHLYNYLLLYFILQFHWRNSFEEAKQPEPMFMILTSLICPIGSIFYFRTTPLILPYISTVWFMQLVWDVENRYKVYIFLQ